MRSTCRSRPPARPRRTARRWRRPPPRRPRTAPSRPRARVRSRSVSRPVSPARTMRDRDDRRDDGAERHDPEHHPQNPEPGLGAAGGSGVADGVRRVAQASARGNPGAVYGVADAGAGRPGEVYAVGDGAGPPGAGPRAHRLDVRGPLDPVPPSPCAVPVVVPAGGCRAHAGNLIRAAARVLCQRPERGDDGGGAASRHRMGRNGEAGCHGRRVASKRVESGPK